MGLFSGVKTNAGAPPRNQTAHVRTHRRNWSEVPSPRGTALGYTKVKSHTRYEKKETRSSPKNKMAREKPPHFFPRSILIFPHYYRGRNVDPPAHKSLSIRKRRRDNPREVWRAVDRSIAASSVQSPYYVLYHVGTTAVERSPSRTALQQDQNDQYITGWRDVLLSWAITRSDGLSYPPSLPARSGVFSYKLS